MVNNLRLVLFLIVQILIWNAGLHAQVKTSEKPDNLQQQKTTFFNEKLQLTATESAKFWPVYNDYQNRRDKITRDRNTLMRYYEMNQPNLKDAEATELIRKYLAFQEEEVRLLEAYTTKFLEFLPARKVMKIFLVELDFKKWLLENLRQNKVQATPRN